MQINNLFRQTVDVLCPLMEEDNRRVLVKKPLHSCKVLEQIEWSGNAQDFTVRLVDRLLKFGNCSEELAIVLVLEEAKQQSGEDKEQEFQSLIEAHKNRVGLLGHSANSNRRGLIYTVIAAVMIIGLLALYNFFEPLYRQFQNSLTPSPSDSTPIQNNESQPITLIPGSLCEATDFDITPSLSEPAGTILSIFGEGKCRGDAMPRATRLTIDGEGFGEDATTRVQAETWTLIKGKHILCFEITVGPWEEAGRACKDVVGE